GSAADVGGVGCPVAVGGVLPGDGDVDVDAEHAGQDGSRDFGGELEQGGGPGRPGGDADLMQASGQVAGADGVAGASAGQQPGGVTRVADGGVATAGGDQVLRQIGERPGELDGFLAQAQEYLAVADAEVI